jgi:hypothetical protein
MPTVPQDALPVMMLRRITGDAPKILMPPPSARPRPLRIVNPSSTDAELSPDLNVTTESVALPSRIVTAGPSVLRRTTAFPSKLMFST